MPTFFKINRPISPELLTHIQAHPKVISALKTNEGQANEFTTITLDQNYTVAQIHNTAVDYIKTKQLEIMNRIRREEPSEYEV